MARITLIERANAKINLHLDVLGKRADGFHEIESLMQSVSLSDELIFTLDRNEERSISLKIEGNDALPNDENNLILRAVKEYEEHRPIEGKLDILLKKRIPTEAGLGGGSADAAATLRALNKLSPNPLDDTDLFDMAASLGSDVPFCLRGGTHICRGRGDLLSHTKPLKNLHLVIINSGERVSTPKAYSDLDKAFGDFKGVDGRIDVNTAASSLHQGSDIKLFNIFEEVVIPLCPIAKSAKEALISLGASAALMSGSGATVFGIFNSREMAKNAEKALKDKFRFVEYAETISHFCK
jgi:4-diphosphocytidyl-2-C-methyl-D-erythritol kinase